MINTLSVTGANETRLNNFDSFEKAIRTVLAAGTLDLTVILAGFILRGSIRHG